MSDEMKKIGVPSQNRRLSFEIDSFVALLPLIAWGVIAYGIRVLYIALGAAFTTVFCEIVISKILKRKSEIAGGSSITLGLYVSLLLPPTCGIITVICGGMLASAVKYLINRYLPIRLCPSVTAVGIMYLLGYSVMSSYVSFGTKLGLSLEGVNIASVTEDVASLKNGLLPDTSLWAMLFGVREGTIGEISVILILAVFIYLVGKKRRSVSLCLGYLASIFAYYYLYPELAIETDIIALQYAFYRTLCCGSVLCAAIFASDTSVCPRNGTASLICGVIGGACTILASKYLPWNVTGVISVTIISLISPLADKLLLRRNVFGGEPHKKSDEKEKSAA